MAVVSALRVAPVKGLATVSVDRVRLERSGVPEDRRVLLLDQKGSVVTLRSHPNLVQLTPSLDLAAATLRVTLPDGTAAESDLTAVGREVRAELYGKQRVGRILAGDAPRLVSEVAGEPVRMVLADTTGVGWDEGPVSILGRASAAAVAGENRDRRRFRMLIEIEGMRPFEEDGWVGQTISVGDVNLDVTQQLVRCVIITQSPETGVKDWEGLHALAEQGRRDLCLGVIAEVATPGEVAVGASVSVAA